MLPLLIPTAELLPEDVPVIRGDFSWDWQEFALSYPGYAAYGELSRLAPMANRERERWESDRQISAPLIELRVRLFFEQRREHNAGGWGDPNPYAYALVEAIRAAVDAGVEGIEDPPGTDGLFPVPLGATAARSAEWWRVNFRVDERFPIEHGAGRGIWLARRHRRPWLLFVFGEEEENCGVLPFTNETEVERFLAAGENLPQDD